MIREGRVGKSETLRNLETVSKFSDFNFFILMQLLSYLAGCMGGEG